MIVKKPYKNPFVGSTRIARRHPVKDSFQSKLFSIPIKFIGFVKDLRWGAKILFGLVLIVLTILIIIFIANSKYTIPINKEILTASDGVHLYINNNVNFTVKFGYLVNNSFQHLVQYETKENQKITMQLINTKEGMKVSKVSTTQDKDNKKETVDIIKFENIFNATNLYYQVTNTSIKEVMVIISQDAPSAFEYSVVTSGVELENSNSTTSGFVFKSNNKPIFGIPALFMKDAKGVTSYDIESVITYIKEDNGDKFYKLEVKPSIAWLKDKDRIFPVEIDPSIVKLDKNQ